LQTHSSYTTNVTTSIRLIPSLKGRDFSQCSLHLCIVQDGELFGIDQSFWETPFTKKEPVEPVKHYLHAKHPVIRGSVLRNSLVSGHVGNLKRYEAVKAKVKEYRDRERTESLDTAPLSMKRATLLEKKYEKRQIRSNAAEMRDVEETSAKERIMEETELADSKDAEDKR